MDLVGHKAQKQYCESFIRRVHAGRAQEHAFIFSGPSEVGKRALALACARSLIRDVPPTWVTGIDAMTVADLIVIAPTLEESKGKIRVKDMSVKAMRDLRLTLAHSVDGKNRVVIIDDAHRMSEGAANALLKMLEEPPKRTFFFLISSHGSRLLPTIISRCATVAFYTLSPADFAMYELGDDDMYVTAMGRPGRVHRLREDQDFAAHTQEALHTISDLRNMSVHEKLAVAQALSLDQSRAEDTLALWIWKIHHIAISQGLFRLLALCSAIETTRREVMTSQTNRRLLLENLLITM